MHPPLPHRPLGQHRSLDAISPACLVCSSRHSCPQTSPTRLSFRAWGRSAPCALPCPSACLQGALGKAASRQTRLAAGKEAWRPEGYLSKPSLLPGCGSEAEGRQQRQRAGSAGAAEEQW